jgi:hypothetical protein
MARKTDEGVLSAADAAAAMVAAANTSEDEISVSLLSPAEAQAKREARRPDVSAFPDALDAEGKPLFRAGDRLVVERRSVVLIGSPWIDTKVYRVLGVDQETGNIRFYDEQINQFAASNYRTATARGSVFKLLPSGARTDNLGKRKRGRPRKEPVAGAEVKPVSTEPKRRRGRPKGVKNRPKDVIAEEKRVRREAKRTGKPMPRRVSAPPVDLTWIFVLPMDALLRELTGV